VSIYDMDLRIYVVSVGSSPLGTPDWGERPVIFFAITHHRDYGSTLTLSTV